MAPDSTSLVTDWLRYQASVAGSRLAAVDLATQRSFTYSEFDDRATRLATALRETLGVAKGDRVGLLAKNSTDHFETMFACWKLGAIFMPLNWRLSREEMAKVIADASPTIVFVDPNFQALVPEGGCPMRLRGAVGQGEYEALIASHEPNVRMSGVTLSDPNTLLYTSGTTGEQKGVIGTHLNSMTIVLQSVTTGAVDNATVCLTYAPLFHTAGLNSFAMPLFHFGGTLYVMDNWDAEAALDHLANPKYGITHTLGVPFHLGMIAGLPRFAETAFPALRLVGVGGAPASRQLIDSWAAKGISLSQSYGMTEAFGLGFQPPEAARANPAAAGKALMYLELQIGNAEGNELRLGERGEIQVRGPGISTGYWNRPDLTQAAWVNGWFRTGDIGVMDPDRTLYVVDRLKDMFISGGENVYPAEVESVISKVPGVIMAAVIGVPDNRWQEVGMAFIVKAPGSPVDEAAVIAACKEKLAGYKAPHHVRFVDALPISPQGKILKWALRDTIKIDGL